MTHPTTKPPAGEALSREEFRREMSVMPSGPEYGRILDHDAALRAELERVRARLGRAEEALRQQRRFLVVLCNSLDRQDGRAVMFANVYQAAELIGAYFASAPVLSPAVGESTDKESLTVEWCFAPVDLPNHKCALRRGHSGPHNVFTAGAPDHAKGGE